ncbi:hypothetical protein SZN_11653 [Streptomyces zinciresistens K42]|uniref:Secreted protein n=1 Tax=Streptomyces zinciresistens K42 TaxID=700597 RepID=G2GA10_9ACTN|nr:hypothetical protein [Streptomyces zinciresistens]EGX59602.1 hypothetical protein SZN_11653 [Streptomyces zinciresistens K42]
MSNIVAKFAATLALVAVPAVGLAAVGAHAGSAGAGMRVVADETTATPSADPTAGKDTTGWQ